ncbi:hypothetical protein BB559_000295 [Furculomyces boomerangus]|uniref:Cap-specific mRNA (nucleoside-2'-O-)-methyltransferase 1 n=2 Tax=Harpellales TaxID=61421 RepID=A0A2T9Z5Q8_9FUNG|nr:hypothetical protein BB559_000295 [Furculomyces boomerangus]PWA02020.1 hypothetical protein BB558_001845 [Smittium angustum]
MDDLYNDSDPAYKNTSIQFKIPPPSSKTMISNDLQKNGSNQLKRSRYEYDDIQYNRRSSYPRTSTSGSPFTNEKSQSPHNDYPIRSNSLQQSSSENQHARYNAIIRSPPLKHDQSQHGSPPPQRVPQPEYKLLGITYGEYSRDVSVPLLDDVRKLFSMIRVSFKKAEDSIMVEPKFYPIQLYERINRLKERMNRAPIEEKNKAKEKADPYALVQNRIFSKYEAMLFASLDAHIKLAFGCIGKENENINVTELCLHKGQTGLSEYLKYKFQKLDIPSKFLVVRIRNDSLFEKEKKPCSIWSIIDSDSTGESDNLRSPSFTNPDFWESQREKVNFEELKLFSKGNVDIVVANLKDSLDVEDAKKEVFDQEYLLKALLYSLTSLKNGGDMVLLLSHGFLTRLSAQILFLMQIVFQKVKVVKPVNSDPLTSQCFLVCRSMDTSEEARVKLVMLIYDIAGKMDSARSDVLVGVPNDQVLGGDYKLTEIFDWEKFSLYEPRFIKFVYQSNLGVGMLRQKHFEDTLKYLDQQNRESYHKQAEIAKKCLECWEIE